MLDSPDYEREYSHQIDYEATINQIDQVYNDLIEYEASLDQAYNDLLIQEETLNESFIAENEATLKRLYAYTMALEYEDPVLAEAYLAAYQEAYDTQFE